MTFEMETLGWNSDWADAFAAAARGTDFIPGRVVRQDRQWSRVVTQHGESLAVPSGRFSYEAADGARPTVGDWVITSGAGDIIHAVLPRKSLLQRRGAGEGRQGQSIAANVDVVFIVEALDKAVNLRRLERVLALTYDSGASPVLVLSKSDICPDVEAEIAQVASIALSVPILAVSGTTGRGLTELLTHLGPGRTGALIGPSGVGKSTLANFLLGEQQLATQPVRSSDGKGRHTTTHRELWILPSGGMLIDSPGMREFGLWNAGDGIDEAFSDISALAQGCRFDDCAHGAEPGCAVRNAVAQGTLDPERLGSFLKLQAEQARLQAKSDPILRKEQKSRERQLTLAGYQRSRDKRRGE